MHQAIGLSAQRAMPVDDPITADNRFVEVVVRWGGRVVDVRRLRAVSSFTVGTADSDDLHVPSDRGSWTLLTSTPAQGWQVRFKGGMSGTVTRGDRSTPLSSSGAVFDGDAFVLSLRDDDVIDIELGRHAIQVQAVSRSRAVSVAAFFDALWANAALVSVLTTSALIAALFLHPVGMHTLDDELRTNPVQFQALFKATPPERTFVNDLTVAKHTVDDTAPSIRPRSRPRERARARAGPIDGDRGDKAVVTRLFGELFGNGGGGAVFADNVDGSLTAALGSVDGAKVAGGVGSLGVRRLGDGAVGIGTLAAGTITTRGGRAIDEDGTGDGDIGEKIEREITMGTLPGILVGSLDPEIFRRVVRDHAGQVRYCYEAALARTPGLAGKVTMKWVINTEGKVTEATTASTDMHSAQVEACLASRIKTWRFPPPKGGGIVVVNYPFVFKQAG